MTSAFFPLARLLTRDSLLYSLPRPLLHLLVHYAYSHLASQHLAHLFVRDPLVIYSEHVELDDEASTDHFENIQSTNWQTLRWKPPPPSDGSAEHPHVGWRTEFRSMEIQLTDFENAAFSVFTVLVSRVILAFDLNTYVPLSMVDENMQTAHRRDAASTERFWFRRHLVEPKGGTCPLSLARSR